jgi:hypothetical protein
VKLVRIWLLVLLAVLLPIRGALAAGMACPNEEESQQQIAMHEHGSMLHDHAMVGTHHLDQASVHDHHAPGHADRCNLCAACCAGAAMAPTVGAVFEPQEPVREVFAALGTPALSFVSDGQERPPRSI